jgi:hypothetical protein
MNYSVLLLILFICYHLARKISSHIPFYKPKLISAQQQNSGIARAIWNKTKRIVSKILSLIFQVDSVPIIDKMITENSNTKEQTTEDEFIGDLCNENSKTKLMLRKRNIEIKRKKALTKGILMVVKLVHQLIKFSIRMYFFGTIFRQGMKFYDFLVDERAIYQNDENTIEDCLMPLKNRAGCVVAEMRHGKWPVVRAMERFVNGVYLCIDAPCSDVFGDFFSGFFTKLAFMILLFMLIIYVIPYVLAFNHAINKHEEQPEKKQRESVPLQDVKVKKDY